MDISAYQHMNIRMSTRGKRPLRNLTPSDKVRAIQRIHNGETKASVSRDIGVPESTLRGWCKNEQKLRFMCRQLGTADHLSSIPGIENPPEKRPRFDNHIQTPKYPGTSNFDEFGYNRLPLNGLSFPSNGNNTILEKIALNEIMKKHIIPTDSSVKPPVDSIANQIPNIIAGPMSLGGDYSTQLSMMQNLNLLSLLSPNLSPIQNLSSSNNSPADLIKAKIPLRLMDESNGNGIKGNSNNVVNNNYVYNNSNSNNKNNSTSNTTSLSVKNWAKDPAEKASINPSILDNNNVVNAAINTNINNNSSSSNVDSNIKSNNYNNQSINDRNNNSLKDKSGSLSIEALPDVVNFLPPFPLGLLQIPNVNNISDSENSNTALLEWCKVFNASLNFLALAAAAAALHPNGALNVANTTKKEDNILYKELTKSASNLDSTTGVSSFINSDISNDSYFDSEPEDLSVRSTATSKLSSPANSRSQSPIKSASCSPQPSDGEN
ncbi:hypothetical protein DOY81_010622 [Sarcophaga bullata]|nr:hypothetical protein DOY81_010622 [Sarcophaga bullata]